jgi:hypothetical protein
MTIHYSSSTKTASVPLRRLLAQAGQLWLRVAPVLCLTAVAYRLLEDHWPGGLIWWLAALWLSCAYHAGVLVYLSRLEPGGASLGWMTGFRRSGRYFMAALLLDGLLLVSSFVALLVAFVVGALLGLVPGWPGALSVVLGIGLLLTPLVIISVGGVLFGLAAVLDGQGAVASIVESFNLARVDWKLTGALVTVPYTLLFLIDWVPTTIALWEAVRRRWNRMPALGSVGASLSGVSRWGRAFSHWMLGVQHAARLPDWYRWGIGPLLEGLAVLYVIANLWVLYRDLKARRDLFSRSAGGPPASG